MSTTVQHPGSGGAAADAPAPTPAGTGRPARRPRAKGRATEALMSRIAVNGALVLATLYMLLPLAWLLIAATKDMGGLFGGDGFAFDGFHFTENVKAVNNESDGIYWRWYLNSLLYAGVGAALGSFVSVLAGYAFDKFDFPGKEKLFGGVLLGVLVPTTAVALPLYLLASKVGLVNTFWAVFIPVIVNPFGVYLARVFSAGYIPGEVLEAARMDGAGEIRTFRAVALPMMMPGFVTIFLFQFTAIWNNFFLPLVMLSDQKLYPVSLGLYSWNTNAHASPEFYPLVITGSLMAVVPLVVAFVSLQRHWRSGLSAGSVK
ncbi:carbohydrate ABC transporter permease [Embleya sp. NPDC020630]|uniref:carbohydrate ABC transporter permease n=1 Tax=Embleya sp. NPDC020630 TaxID=3363979 RepID=UPI0037A9222B